MKIWVIGKTGLLGKTLDGLCKKRFLNAVATSQTEVDITQLPQLLAFIEREKITHIINCAAYTNVDEAEALPGLAYKLNAEGPENLGIAARKKGCNLVHVSTDYVFDGSKGKAYKEDDLCQPLNVYGHSKWLGEQKLLEQLPTACIVRTSWLFGKGGKNFVSQLLNLVKEKSELRIVADQMGRLTYVPDLADALLEMLCHTGVFHFANSGVLSRYDVAQAVLEEGKVTSTRILEASAKEFPARAKRPDYSVLCTEKIEGVLGKPPRHWREALNEYMRHET